MVIKLTEQNVENITEGSKPAIINAFATWCPHCTNMKPVFEKLEKELGSKYTFAEFDTDAQTELTEKFDVTGLPTFIFIKNKKEVGRSIGAMSEEEFKNAIQENLG